MQCSCRKLPHRSLGVGVSAPCAPLGSSCFLNSLTISKSRHAQPSLLLSGPTLPAGLGTSGLARSCWCRVPAVRFGGLRAWAESLGQVWGHEGHRGCVDGKQLGDGRFEVSARFYSRCASAPGPLSPRRPSPRPSPCSVLCAVCCDTAAQHKVHASTLVPIAPLSQRQRLPLSQ